MIPDRPTRRRIGTRLSIGIGFTIGIVAVGTGIVHITYAPVLPVLDPYIPSVVRSAVGFTLALTGFLLMLAAYGLYRRYRAGWYWTMLLLPVVTAQGIIQSSPLAIPLVVLAVIGVVLIGYHRGQFTGRIGLSTAQIATGLALVGVQVYGTVGAYTLREEFANIQTVLDAFYFTIVTASTVGYGDLVPLTPQAKLFAMSVLLFGTASFGAAIGVLLGPAIEARLAAGLGRVRDRQLEQLTDHVIVLGYSDFTEPIITELSDQTEFVVITEQTARVNELTDRGITAIHGDPGDEQLLKRVQLTDAAAAIVATTNDSVDAFIALTIAELAPDVRTVAAVTNSENVSKLRRAGADVVVDPATVGAYLLVDAVESTDH